MKKNTAKLLALLLSLVLFVTMTPLTALASFVPADETVCHSASADENAVVSNGKPRITAQPKSRSVMQGAKITLKVTAKGSGLKYQWYYRKNSRSKWTKVSGGTKATLKITVGRNNGCQYRCRVSNRSGAVNSKAATLKVNYITYRALLVGQIYEGVSGLEPLIGDVDCSYMYDLLAKVKGPEGGAYSVAYYKDLSRYGIHEAIAETFAGADSNDVSLFYFTGHGDDYASYTDPDAGALCTVEGSDYGLLQLQDLAGWLKAVPGKVIVFIDSCGSGAAVYGNGLTANAQKRAAGFNQAVVNAFAAADVTIAAADGTVSNAGEFRQTKFIVLTSSRYRQSSGYTTGYDGGAVSHFTYWLWYGAVPYGSRQMDADTNRDHILTLKELYTYIKRYDSYDYYIQNVQVYPSATSTYRLFKS